MKIIPRLFFLIFRSHKKGILHPILVSFYLFSDLIRKVSCDHYRATYFYIATVKEENRSQCLWEAYPCRSVLDFKNGNCRKCNGECPTMGYRADETKQTGSFYLKTNNKAPFCGEKILSEDRFFPSSYLHLQRKIWTQIFKRVLLLILK